MAPERYLELFAEVLLSCAYHPGVKDRVSTSGPSTMKALDSAISFQYSESSPKGLETTAIGALRHHHGHHRPEGHCGLVGSLATGPGHLDSDCRYPDATWAAAASWVAGAWCCFAVRRWCWAGWSYSNGLSGRYHLPHWSPSTGHRPAAASYHPAAAGEHCHSCPQTRCWPGR